MRRIIVPNGAFASREEEAAARKRKELRDKLLRGETLKVAPSGPLMDPRSAPSDAIVVPPGKLASLYWYEREPSLLESEMLAMQQFFPQFTLGQLEDGRLFWAGLLETDLRPGGAWHLQAVYENNHPSNSSWGGSVKIYSILPDLESIRDNIGPIPHTLSDSAGNLYLCTARMEDVKAGNLVTSAASSLAWAAKWIAVFEIWLAGDLTTAKFQEHI